MRMQPCARWGAMVVSAIGFLAFSACGTNEPEPGAVPATGLGAKRHGRRSEGPP